MFILAVVLSALINLFAVPFWIMGFPQGFLLPRLFQILWLVTILGAFEIFRARGDGWKPPAWLRWTATGVFMLLIFACRTTYPSVHGDGEYGAAGYMTWSNAIRTDPVLGEWRLPAHLNRVISRHLPLEPDFEFHVGMPERPNPFPTFRRLMESRHRVNATWIILSMITGVLTALAVAVATGRLQATETAKLGTVLFITFSPPMLNMFGHFDSYWLAVALILCWFGSISTAGLRPWTRFGFSMTIALVGAWTHPALTLLPILTCADLFLRFNSRRVSGKSLFWLSLAAGVALGLLPLLSPRSRATEWTLLNLPMLSRFATERLLLAFATGLPALLLALASVRRGSAEQYRVTPNRSTAVVACAAGLTSYFTLNFTLGPIDELNAGVSGTIILGAAWMLWHTSTSKDRSILWAGLLSLYLFLPKAIVFSNDRVVDYFRRMQPNSICIDNRTSSPSLLLALRCPVDNEKNRTVFLDVLRDGSAASDPLWSDYRLLNGHYFTAWSYEFGYRDQAREQLHWLLEHAARTVPSLWFDGARFTDRYENRAAAAVREDTRRWIQSRLQDHPEDLALQGMLVVLRKCETRDWTPSELARWSYDQTFKGEREGQPGDAGP